MNDHHDCEHTTNDASLHRDADTSHTPNEQVPNKRISDHLAGGIYADLRRIAQSLLAHERLDHTLSATALVHEAYLRLIDQTASQWSTHEHLRALATLMMNRILIDHARGRAAAKRGGIGGPPLSLSRDDEETLLAPDPDQPMAAVVDALERLRTLDERQFFIVHLRIYGGMSSPQIARAMGLSLRTVEREWAMAKAWLRRELSTAEEETERARDEETELPGDEQTR